jgi:hypothetical protein
MVASFEFGRVPLTIQQCYCYVHKVSDGRAMRRIFYILRMIIHLGDTKTEGRWVVVKVQRRRRHGPYQDVLQFLTGVLHLARFLGHPQDQQCL